MIKKNIKFLLLPAFVFLTIWIFRPDPSVGAGCPECPTCQITAKSINQEEVDYSGKKYETMTRIKLHSNIDEIQIGEDMITKQEFDQIIESK